MTTADSINDSTPHTAPKVRPLPSLPPLVPPLLMNSPLATGRPRSPACARARRPGHRPCASLPLHSRRAASLLTPSPLSPPSRRGSTVQAAQPHRHVARHHYRKRPRHQLAVREPEVRPQLHPLPLPRPPHLVLLADPRRPARRQKFVFEKLVSHLHNFARDVSLTTDEWMYVSLSLPRAPRRAGAALTLALSRSQDRHPVPHPGRPDLLQDAPRIHPPLRCARPVGARRRDEPSRSERLGRDRGDRPRALLHRGRSRRTSTSLFLVGQGRGETSSS